MTTGKWFSPDDVIADALFDAGDRFEAQMKNGETVQLIYGDLTSDGTDNWMGFYNDDGEEVFVDDINLVSSLSQAERK